MFRINLSLCFRPYAKREVSEKTTAHYIVSLFSEPVFESGGTALQKSLLLIFSLLLLSFMQYT